jgi:hypothetical protein
LKLKTERFIVEKIEAKDLEKAGYVSITDYCRYLVDNHPEDLPSRIEIYRGEMLCITVPNVSVAAELEPAGVGFRQHRPERLSKGRGRVKTK